MKSVTSCLVVAIIASSIPGCFTALGGTAGYSAGKTSRLEREKRAQSGKPLEPGASEGGGLVIGGAVGMALDLALGVLIISNLSIGGGNDG